MGRTFHFFVRLLLFQGFLDTQCGFKMFKKETVEPIFSKLRIEDFGFDLEVLYLARLMDFKIKEVPINWVHVPESKVNFFKDPLKMFVNILQIRCWHR